MGTVSSAEVICTKACELFSYDPIAVRIWVRGIVRSPQRFPRLREGGWVSGERKAESHERPLFSPRTQELVGLNINAPKKVLSRQKQQWFSWDIFLYTEKESCEGVAPLGKGYVCIPKWEPKTRCGLTSESLFPDTL